MGAKLAERISASETCSSLSVFSGRSLGTRAAAAQLVADHGVIAEPSIHATVTGADVIFTCLPRSSDVKEVAADLIAKGSLKPGSVWIDTTSGDPASAVEIAELLASEATQCTYLDCAVSGGPQGATAGTLTCMLGATQDSPVLNLARPLMASFSKNIVHCGSIGSGFAIKAVQTHTRHPTQKTKQDNLNTCLLTHTPHTGSKQRHDEHEHLGGRRGV